MKMSNLVTDTHLTDNRRCYLVVTVTYDDRGVAAGRGYCECVVYSEYDDSVSVLPQEEEGVGEGGPGSPPSPVCPHTAPPL